MRTKGERGGGRLWAYVDPAHLPMGNTKMSYEQYQKIVVHKRRTWGGFAARRAGLELWGPHYQGRASLWYLLIVMVAAGLFNGCFFILFLGVRVLLRV